MWRHRHSAATLNGRSQRALIIEDVLECLFDIRLNRIVINT